MFRLGKKMNKLLRELKFFWNTALDQGFWNPYFDQGNGNFLMGHELPKYWREVDRLNGVRNRSQYFMDCKTNLSCYFRSRVKSLEFSCLDERCTYFRKTVSHLGASWVMLRRFHFEDQRTNFSCLGCAHPWFITQFFGQATLHRIQWISIELSKSVITYAI